MGRGCAVDDGVWPRHKSGIQFLCTDWIVLAHRPAQLFRYAMTLKSNAHKLALIAQETGAEVMRGPRNERAE